VVAGLFIRSLDQAARVNLGFNRSHVLNVSMDPHEVGYDPDQARGAEQPAGRRDWMNDGMSTKLHTLP